MAQYTVNYNEGASGFNPHRNGDDPTYVRGARRHDRKYPTGA